MRSSPAAPASARTGRRLAWLLWPTLIAYVALVAWRAHGELNANAEVVGLFRTWRPPQTLPIGQIFDPRTGALATEIDARFKTRGPRPQDDAISAWRSALAARGLQPVDARGPGDGEPRVVFMPSGPWLIVQRAHNGFVTFDPQRGMMLLHEGVIAPQTPALVVRP